MATASRVASPAERLRRGGHTILADIRSRCRTEQQADAAERLIRTLSRDQSRKGDQLTYTWRQLAGALGKPVEGLSQRQARDRYRGPIRHTLLYLIEWGYVAGFEALYEPNGEGRCILIRLPAGVAQSVRASGNSRTDVRRGAARGRSSFCREVDTPLREPLRRAGPSSSSATRDREAERARARGSARDRAASALQARAALVAAAQVGGDEEGGFCGVGLLRADPSLADLPVESLAREAWRLFAGADEISPLGGDGRLSPRGRSQLERASSQLARVGYGGLAGPAAAAAAAIDIARGDWQLYWSGRGPAAAAVMRREDAPPATFGGIVLCLHRCAHQERAGWRARRARRRARA